MIYQCNYCNEYFSRPYMQRIWTSDPRGGMYPNYQRTADTCPICCSDDLDYFESLIDYKGKYYIDRLHLSSYLRKRGFSEDEIKKAQDEAIEIWEVDE